MFVSNVSKWFFLKVSVVVVHKVSRVCLYASMLLSLDVTLQEFRQKAHLARHLASAHGVNVMANSPRPVTKTRAAFCLVTSAVTRLARQVCADILHIRRAARQPLTSVNIALIRQECEYTTYMCAISNVTCQECEWLIVLVVECCRTERRLCSICICIIYCCIMCLRSDSHAFHDAAAEATA